MFASSSLIGNYHVMDKILFGCGIWQDQIGEKMLMLKPEQNIC